MIFARLRVYALAGLVIAVSGSAALAQAPLPAAPAPAAPSVASETAPPLGGPDAVDYLSIPRVTQDSPAMPVRIGPRDPRVRYMGRFDFSEPAGPRCTWSASTVALWIKGSGAQVDLGESTNNGEYDVSVDGLATEVLAPSAGTHILTLFQNADPKHVHAVLLVKRTEGFFDVSQFLGFRLARGARLVAPPPSTGRRIELIGDSISCGFGDEAPNQNAKFSAQTENAYLSYGDIAARDLGANYACIAWSGRLMWPTNTMADVYGRTLATDPQSVWDLAKWRPQVVVINLGTNDAWNNAFADPQAWVWGYEQFISRLRGSYPDATIYCTSSPMLTGDKDTTERSLIHKVIVDENAAGDKRVKFLDFATQDPANGYGAQWHPSIKTHEIMAAKLEQVLDTDMGWTPVK